jgi:hypothetical protein
MDSINNLSNCKYREISEQYTPQSPLFYLLFKETFLKFIVNVFKQKIYSRLNLIIMLLFIINRFYTMADKSLHIDINEIL